MPTYRYDLSSCATTCMALVEHGVVPAGRATKTWLSKFNSSQLLVGVIHTCTSANMCHHLDAAAVVLRFVRGRGMQSPRTCCCPAVCVILQAADTELLGFGDDEGDEADSDMEDDEDDSEDEQTPKAAAAAAAKKGEPGKQL